MSIFHRGIPAKAIRFNIVSVCRRSSINKIASVAAVMGEEVGCCDRYGEGVVFFDREVVDRGEGGVNLDRGDLGPGSGAGAE
jgi:hypothetical protein